MMTAEELTPLARAIRDAKDLESQPDLILRLVDLLFLLRDDTPVPS